MTDSVSFKAYLKLDGTNMEVRRFGIDGGAATSYMYLRSKIQTVFPSIQNDQFKVMWQDKEMEWIAMDSDDELLEALTSTNQQPHKIVVEIQSKNNGGAGATTSSAERQPHAGVVCDSCENSVVGFRYKCVTCPDFDLCSLCENKGLHPEHFMLRMPMQINSFLHHPKFIRKMFTHPYKFHKRHGWSRPTPPPRGCGDAQNGVGRCPFSRPGVDVATAFGDVTDMFDFSALTDYFKNVAIANSEARAGQSTGAGTTTSSAAPNHATPSSSQAQSGRAGQSTGPGTTASAAPNEASQYLNTIGQMVASILDPLGLPPKKKNEAATKIMKNVYKLRKCSSKYQKKSDMMLGLGKVQNGSGHAIHYKGHSTDIRTGFGHRPKHGNSKPHHGHGKPYHGHGKPQHGYGKPHHGYGALFRHRYQIKCQGQAEQPKFGCRPKHGIRGPRVNHRFRLSPNKHQDIIEYHTRPCTPEVVVIEDNSDIEIVFEDVGVDVTFDVKTKKPSQQQQPGTTAPATAPTPTPPAAPTSTPVTTSTPSTSIPEVPSASSQTETTPAATTETQTEPIRGRRNSDDWTLINRESPTRSEATAMDVDESAGAKTKTPLPSASQTTPPPSAPPQADDLSDAERQRIQDAIETFRSMGFNFNTNNLREVLKRQNCDILTVLEMMLNNERK